MEGITAERFVAIPSVAEQASTSESARRSRPFVLKVVDRDLRSKAVAGYNFAAVTAPSEAEETSAAYLAKTPDL